ncbi:Uncharacterised protein [Nocardia otitidiscaviarum]|uniref:Uncharacterized protein n=1 Tax=Nocardia otitidiscaviarum TaxID=1823 RepID=A0A378YHP8_9NOCA|nr:helix-turn-helix transcriptional regulator [Nocardia otitidiscaviarum]SUA75929.1 Uncharacterised protein [Nocardia otitidiscaviarum]
MAGHVLASITVPRAVWDREQTRTMLCQRDIAALLHTVQQHTGASQHRLAMALGMSQGRVNELINRRRNLTSLTSFERLADGLQMPDSARIALGLAPRMPVIPDLTEISVTYRSQADASADIRELAAQATAIDVMAVRGLGILGLNDSLLREALSSDVRLRVLLLDPDCEAARFRAEEIGESPECFSVGISLCIARVRELARSNHPVELYTYDRIPVWRILKLDEVLFVSAFTAYGEGHSSSTHRIDPNRRGILHHAFVRVLEQSFADATRLAP